MSKYLETAIEIAHDAGAIILKYFDKPLNIQTKEDNTPVTVADEEINATVIERLGVKFPDMAVIGEEGSNGIASDRVWVCDPIDGTIPFMKGVPVSVFSLALVENGNPTLGVVFDPFTDRMYTAEKGKGAFLNEKPIRVSTKKLVPGTVLFTESWKLSSYDTELALRALSLDTGIYTMHIGSTVQESCLVARGSFEANIFPGTKGKFVDAAAAKIIVEEAGGRVTDILGNNQRYDRDINGFVMSNGVVHDEIVAYIKKYAIKPQ